MNENAISNEETVINTHMNSIQFYEQDHLDLQFLNQRQCETIKEYTYDEIKTEGIIQKQRSEFNNSSSYNGKVNRILYLDEQNSQDDKKLKHTFTIEQKKQEQNQQLQLSIINSTTEQNKNNTQESNLSKIKDSTFSKESCPQNLKEFDGLTKSKMISAKKDKTKNSLNPQNLIKSINLLVNVKSFYRLLTKNTRILGKLTRDQHYLINDITSIFQKNYQTKINNQNSYFTKIKKALLLVNFLISSLINCIPMFEPYNLSKFLWDILQAILILSVMFIFSLVNFFQMEVKGYISFFQIVFTIFVLDMLFTFNTGVVEKGNVSFDRKKAAIAYLKKNFIMDQIALLPLFTFVLNVELHGLYSWAIYFQILFKLFVLSDTFSRLTYYLSYQKNLKNIVDLVKLVFIIACVCHIFCLFWHGLAIYEINLGYSNTWLQMRKIEGADVFTRYVQSFYYLAVTMITVGYGDITPQTTYEILFTTITMFVTGFFYAFSLNRIGSIIENIEMKDKSYKESMQVIHRLMREESVSQTLRVQISNYLQYLYKESNEIGKQQEIEIINRLSKQLKYDLTQDIQGKYLKDIEFIDKLETKSKIVEIMEECLFSPGEYIFKQGDIDDCSLYYIVKGSVKIMFDYSYRDQTESLIISHLKKGQYFGDMQFIQGNCRILTAQASDFCRTYKIPRELFFKCIKQSDQDFENFQMLKEAYVFKDNQKLFQIKCYTCNKSDHTSIKCPKTHLTFSKQTLIQKENKSSPHLQRVYKQRSLNKYNSLSYNQDVINIFYQFIEKSENQLQIEILEEQMHLSLDEAFLEQQLLELEKIDNFEQCLLEQKNIEVTNETISEVDQEDEDLTNKSSSFVKNDTFQSTKRHIHFANQNNLIYNQSSETENIQDASSQTEQFLSSYCIQDKSKVQSVRKNSSHLSIEKMQSNNSILDQQDYSNVQRHQIIKESSNLSIYSQKVQDKLAQQQSMVSEECIFTQGNIPSTVHNSFQINDLVPQNKFQKSDFKNQQGGGRQQYFFPEEINLNESQKNLNDFVFKNSPTLKNEKIKLFRKQKSKSLTDLNQNQISKQIESQQTDKGYVKKRNQESDKLSKDISQSISLKNGQEQVNSQSSISKGSGNTSLCQIEDEQYSKGKKTNFTQTTSYNSKNTYQKKSAYTLTSSNHRFQEEHLQKSSTSIKNSPKQKQNANDAVQSSLVHITNHDINHSKKEQSTNKIQKSQSDLIRQQSKKYNQKTQFKLQKRPSQVLSPCSLYSQNQIHNPSLKHYNNQLHMYQSQENNQNNLKQSQSFQRRQSINHNNSNLNNNLLNQISNSLKNSPLIQYRRPNQINLNILSQIKQEITKKNLNSMVLENQENSKNFIDAYNRRRTSQHSEVGIKESARRILQQGSRFDLYQYQQNNSLLQNNLSLLQTQILQKSQCSRDDNMQQLKYIDSSYLMLQIFDKPNNFKYYHPIYNISLVIQNLKQNDNKLKKKLSLRKQISRNTTQNFGRLKQTTNQIKTNKVKNNNQPKIQNQSSNINQN